MQRAVSSLPLSSGWLAKLASCGFERVDDLKDVGVVELSKEICVSNSEALEIIRVAKGASVAQPSPTLHPTLTPSHPHTAPHHDISHHNNSRLSLKGHSALDLLRREQVRGSIVTFCAGIDGMMGGGVALGKVTEFCGGPGLGKTQMSIQLAVDVSIPELLGGVGGEAVYIDTEGSFIVERVAEVASAAVQHLNSMADGDSEEAHPVLDLETVLSNIHLYRCHDHLELLATINILPDFIQQHPKVRLVVIDSIAAHFRHGFTDMSRRNRLLNIISQNLIHIATAHNIAVVLTNQMTTKVSHGVRNSAQLVPALGESWGHASTVRVILSWSGSERLATLHKSPTQREATAPFLITADGIRDPPSTSNSRSAVDPSSQCMPLCEDFFRQDDDNDDAFSDTDDIMANIRDPSVWQGGEGEGGRGEDVRGDGGAGVVTHRGDEEKSTDSVSVSSVQDTLVGSERERRGRKRPHPSDPEL